MFLIINLRPLIGCQYKTQGHPLDPLDLLDLKSSKDINERWVGHDALLSMELVHVCPHLDHMP